MQLLRVGACTSLFSSKSGSGLISDFSHKTGMDSRRLHLVRFSLDGDAVGLVCVLAMTLGTSLSSESKPTSADGETERLFLLAIAIGMMKSLFHL